MYNESSFIRITPDVPWLDARLTSVHGNSSQKGGGLFVLFMAPSAASWPHKCRVPNAKVMLNSWGEFMRESTLLRRVRLETKKHVAP